MKISKLDIQRLLAKYHIDRLVKIDEEKSYYEFDKSINKFVFYCDKKLSPKDLYDLLISNEQDFISIYNSNNPHQIKTKNDKKLSKVKNSSNSPTFKVNEVLGEKIRYVPKKNTDSFDFVYNAKAGTYDVEYDDKYLDEVDEYVQEHLEHFKEFISWPKEAQKLLTKYNGTYMPPNSYLPHEMSNLPVIYHNDKDVENSKNFFDLKSDEDVYAHHFYLTKNLSLNQLYFLKNTLIDVFNKTNSEKKRKSLYEASLQSIFARKEDELLFNPLRDGKIDLWGKKYDLEIIVSSKYLPMIDGEVFFGEYEINYKEKTVTFKINPHDNETEHFRVIVLSHFYGSVLEEYTSQFLSEHSKDFSKGVKDVEFVDDFDLYYKLNKRSKLLKLHKLLASKPKICTEFLCVYANLSVNYKEGSKEFYEKLYEVLPNWTKTAEILADSNEDQLINCLGIRHIEHK